MGADDNQGMQVDASPSASGLDPRPALPLGVLSFEGPDAGAFLQGQLTQDVLSMSTSEARPAGYCSAKGRLMATFVVLRTGEQAWWLLLPRSLLEPIGKRLKMFVLRAQCRVEALGQWQVQCLEHSSTPLWQVQGTAGGELQVGWFGSRALRLTAADPQAGLSAEQVLQWAWSDINAGWPWVVPATSEQFVPQMINLELLGGVNFRKGCYPGQEVVARSQYRGTLKRRMALYAVAGVLPQAPEAGTEIFHSLDPEQPAGMVVNASLEPQGRGGVRLLAEVKLAATTAGTLHLGSADGPALNALALPYPVPTEAQD